MSLVQIHFDGDIAVNHQVSMRTLGKTLTHLQNSMDRAYLEQHYGQLWKFAKMRQEFYQEVELLVQEPKEGGYVLDFLSSNPVTKAVINRVSSAVNGAVEASKQAGLDKATKIEDSLSNRIAQVESGILVPKDLQTMIDNPDASVIRRYGDRAISREIDQILSIIRAGNAGDSTFELLLSGDKSAKFDFNKESAGRFHSTVSRRELGEPVLYTATISSLDRHNNNGKIYNLITQKVANIHFFNEDFLEMAMPFFQEKKEMVFVGSPLIEYGAFDPNAGDIYFIKLA
ncbi:hypothetical protein J3L11_08920 [Shewanella sp. 4t3-1-2LB]|uniref:hypothetical protein n=1 Tax=Shewanella sp. 4t3-1-2LB TaxID=2817682 RepID=UPI001A99BBAE|nr:hypothetical protein [Shewanella sp. 4t3-1-2LB]MBO1271760.1 hypothetical protein [Shewanella sp. 4t3-1-2LB]